MAAAKYNYFLVRAPKTVSKRETMDYIRDAVRGWGGGSAPDHPFYRTNIRREIVVKPTLHQMEQDAVLKLRREMETYFANHVAPAGVYYGVMGIIEKYVGKNDA